MGGISHRRLQCRAAARISALARARRKAESLIAEGLLGHHYQGEQNLREIQRGVNVGQQLMEEVDLGQRRAALEGRGQQLEVNRRQLEPTQPLRDETIVKPEVKMEFKLENDIELPEVKEELEDKAEFDIKAEFGIKSEFEIKVEFDIMVEFQINSELGIKAESEIKAELEIKTEPGIKTEHETKSETEVKPELDIKMEDVETEEEYLKMEDDLKMEGLQMGDAQMEWVVVIKEELVKLEGAPWRHAPYHSY